RPSAGELDDHRVARRVDLLDVQLHVVGESGPVHLGDGDPRVRAALSLAIASPVAVLGMEKLPVARHVIAVNRVYHLSNDRFGVSHGGASFRTMGRMNGRIIHPASRAYAPSLAPPVL